MSRRGGDHVSGRVDRISTFIAVLNVLSSNSFLRNIHFGYRCNDEKDTPFEVGDRALLRLLTRSSMPFVNFGAARGGGAELGAR